ncbi:hypothetical protein [Rubricoccus marinus]|uniref:Uncharacterized protein n=1 Tax=Rubricoccus marinus TaxID=716817 RepID=A0A259U3B7_9BACT|nr:hypothetical protein [Rubricoccus marinus]OZC04486.1 hypothetical protein BSZ36_16795 [Rubricoccus marinus]
MPTSVSEDYRSRARLLLIAAIVTDLAAVVVLMLPVFRDGDIMAVLPIALPLFMLSGALLVAHIGMAKKAKAAEHEA